MQLREGGGASNRPVRSSGAPAVPGLEGGAGVGAAAGRGPLPAGAVLLADEKGQVREGRRTEVRVRPLELVPTSPVARRGELLF